MIGSGDCAEISLNGELCRTPLFAEYQYSGRSPSVLPAKQNGLFDKSLYSMKIIIISQVFWPDESAGSQILTDLAMALTLAGSRIDVITSGNAYEDSNTRYRKKEYYQTIHIRRLWNTSFGKGSKLGRFINYFIFNVTMLAFLLTTRKGHYDLMISLSIPPLVSFFGMIAARMKRIKLLYWAMDLQPELGIQCGYLKQNSLTTRLLLMMSDLVCKESEAIVTLDEYMAGHILRKGAKRGTIRIIPVWPIISKTYVGDRLENPFRIEHGFGDKLVVMYSGNHSVMHPLDTILNAALQLKDDPRFLFVFVGAGVRKRDVADFRKKHLLVNIVQLPLQRRDKIHFSLSSADIHAVVLGNGCRGFTHPSKVYGAMGIGRPILYIGPKESHVGDLLKICSGNISVEQNQTEALAKELLLFANMGADQWDIIGRKNRDYVKENYSREDLIGTFVSHIEATIRL